MQESTQYPGFLGGILFLNGGSYKAAGALCKNMNDDQRRVVAGVLHSIELDAFLGDPGRFARFGFARMFALVIKDIHGNPPEATTDIATSVRREIKFVRSLLRKRDLRRNDADRAIAFFCAINRRKPNPNALHILTTPS